MILATLISLVTYLFQVADAAGAVSILREFGFPVLVAIGMFIYFSREIKTRDGDLSKYRAEILAEQKSQTSFLRQMLSEAKQANVCKYEERR